MNIRRNENLIIGSSIACLFLIFIFCWLKNPGAWVYGLYSEVDGQLAAWLSRYLVKWGKPFDISTLNPFQGMGSLFIPLNSWWNPGALILGILNSSNKLLIFTLSYAIYWVEVFFAIYFLSKTIGLKKIESVLAAEIFVIFLFPPFSAYFRTIPYFSLAPQYAHFFTLASIILITYVKLGEDKRILQNLLLVFILMLSSFLLIMTSGFYFIPFVPIYALIAMGFMANDFNRQNIFWKGIAITLIASFFLIPKGYLYYKDTIIYGSAAVETTKGIQFNFPKTLQAHLSIFYGSPPMFSYMHIFAFIGGIIGLFFQSGKIRWVSFSFLIIILLPDLANFIFENAIVTGSISQLNSGYYLWCAYPLYCIFFVIFISFILNSTVKMLTWVTDKLFLIGGLRNKYFSFNSSLVTYLKLLILLSVIPVTAFKILNQSQYHDELKKPAETPIIRYLEKEIGLTPRSNFRGSTISYFASQESVLREIIGQPYEADDKANHFTLHHYILAREFLNKRFQNRHMFSDLWNFNIPTLEEYGQLISRPMYIFFKEMLANKDDILNYHFLNVYKLDLDVLRALGVRFIISDKILGNKNLSLIMMQQQNLNNSEYVDYHIFISAKKIFEQLEPQFKKGVEGSIFKQEFFKELNKIYPYNKEKAIAYIDSAINSAIQGNQNLDFWSYADLEKIRNFLNLTIFAWAMSPPLYLYEIKNPNLATFSPTNVIQLKSSEKIFTALHSSNFSFEKDIIIQNNLPQYIIKQLVPIKDSEMRFERNKVRIKSQSNSWSILLLPLQYSHCFQIIKKLSVPSSGPIYIFRANLIQTGLLFNKKIDVKLIFDFGVSRNATCRRKDIEDLESLKL